MANIKISPAAAEVLSKGTFKGNTFILPAGQLARSLYDEVNKVLIQHGAKWKRGSGHVFANESELARFTSETVKTGVSVDKKKNLQQFYTPAEVALQAAYHCSLAGMKVLEPSAGRGSLAAAAIVTGAQDVKCYELDADNVKELKARGFKCEQADFLTLPMPDDDIFKFDRVLMNPPFTKNQDLKHIAHAISFLRFGGRLVSIIQGNRTRQDIFEHLPKFARDRVADSMTILPLDDEAFKEAGTKIKTAIVIIDL